MSDVERNLAALREAIHRASLEDEAQAYADDDGEDDERDTLDPDPPEQRGDPLDAQIADTRNKIVRAREPERSRLEVMLQGLMRRRAQGARQ